MDQKRQLKLNNIVVFSAVLDHVMNAKYISEKGRKKKKPGSA